MKISQNSRFFGQAKVDKEFEHPAGASIARLLKSGLEGSKWSVPSFENWKDFGWMLSCSYRDTRLSIEFSEVEEGEWVLQVAPTRVPGFIGRLFGGSMSSVPSETLELATLVHSILYEEGSFDQFMWKWDDYPTQGSSTPIPK